MRTVDTIEPPPGTLREKGRKPRICMPSSMRFATKAFQFGLREAQDILMAVDDVDVIPLDTRWDYLTWEKWKRIALAHDWTKKLACVNPGFRPVRLEKEYDLFLMVCPECYDVLQANAILGWKDQCKTSVCWIDELWANRVPYYDNWFHVVSRFDYVFIGLSNSVEIVSKAIGKPCHYVSGGVDAIRFSPYPWPKARVIDCYSVGRRWEGMHRALLQLAAEQDLFYVHDTIQGGDSEAADHRQHRELYANMAKRSRFFTVAPAKMDCWDHTHGQIEPSYRFYEGAAAGTIMIGQAPDCDAYRSMFDWPQAVIPVRSDGADLRETILRLSKEPETMARISARNAAQALLRHDWVYRWKKILSIADLAIRPAMEGRLRQLKDLAELAHLQNPSETTMRLEPLTIGIG